MLRLKLTGFWASERYFFHSFSLATRFAKHWLLVFVLGFLEEFQVVEKTKNPSHRTGFWTTRANAFVAQTTDPARWITSYIHHYRYYSAFSINEVSS